MYAGQCSEALLPARLVSDNDAEQCPVLFSDPPGPGGADGAARHGGAGKRLPGQEHARVSR